MGNVYQKGMKRLSKHNHAITLLFLIMVLFITMVVAVSIGPITIPFQQTVFIFLDKLNINTSGFFVDQHSIVITDIRLPRVIVAALVGCSLAISGVAMQGLFRTYWLNQDLLGFQVEQLSVLSWRYFSV